MPIDNQQFSHPPLPESARLPINHCNLPASILGSLSFQEHPVPLELDGVRRSHVALLDNLDKLSGQLERARFFMDYMSVHFRLHRPEDAGADRKSRKNADYLRLLRGWFFDPNGKEAAVLKSWVESRFGLLPRYHKGELDDFNGPSYQRYLADRSQGLYNTNALEAQLDLLYSYCQYELLAGHAYNGHMRLYRGVNRVDSYDIVKRIDKHRAIVLLNNLNSFTDQRERADEFGDYILETSVPLQKIFWFPGLLPGKLKGENEMLVIGGMYRVVISTF